MESAPARNQLATGQAAFCRPIGLWALVAKHTICRREGTCIPCALLLQLYSADSFCHCLSLIQQTLHTAMTVPYQTCTHWKRLVMRVWDCCAGHCPCPAQVYVAHSHSAGDGLSSQAVQFTHLPAARPDCNTRRTSLRPLNGTLYLAVHSKHPTPHRHPQVTCNLLLPLLVCQHVLLANPNKDLTACIGGRPWAT